MRDLLNWLRRSPQSDEEREMRDLRKKTLQALREYDHRGRRFGEEGGKIARQFAQRHADSLDLLDRIDISKMSDAQVEDFLTESRYATFRNVYWGE